MALLPEDPALADLFGTEKTPRHVYRGLGFVSSRVTRMSYSRQTSGGIMFVHGYQDGRDDWYGLGPSLVPFRLVVPPLQLGVVGPYPA
jgi:hypothetical protein